MEATVRVACLCVLLGDGPANADSFTDARRQARYASTTVAMADFGVGKTALANALAGTLHKPDAAWKPMVAGGVELTSDDGTVRVSVVDTGGGEDYPLLLRPMTIAAARVAVVVASWTDEESMRGVESRWLPELRAAWRPAGVPIKVVLAVNKADLAPPPGPAAMRARACVLMLLARSERGAGDDDLGTLSILPSDVLREIARSPAWRGDPPWDRWRGRLERLEGVQAVVVCSAVTGRGLDELRHAIMRAAATEGSDIPPEETGGLLAASAGRAAARPGRRPRCVVM